MDGAAALISEMSRYADACHFGVSAIEGASAPISR